MLSDDSFEFPFEFPFDGFLYPASILPGGDFGPDIIAPELAKERASSVPSLVKEKSMSRQGVMCHIEVIKTTQVIARAAVITEREVDIAERFNIESVLNE